MIKDNINAYFDTLTKLIDDEYDEECGYSQRKNDSPPQFPFVYFHQIGGMDRYETLSETIEGADVTVEIIVYHNKGVNKVRKLADFIRKRMTEREYGLNFKCNMFSPTDNFVDSSVQMFVGRYTKSEFEKE